jgi:hypothetical protein
MPALVMLARHRCKPRMLVLLGSRHDRRQALVASGQSEFPRECEDDVDMVGGQQFLFPCLEPAQAGSSASTANVSWLSA